MVYISKSFAGLQNSWSLPPSFFLPSSITQIIKMANDFDSFLAEVTKKEDAIVHGLLIKCIDKNGGFCATTSAPC